LPGNFHSLFVLPLNFLDFILTSASRKENKLENKGLPEAEVMMKPL
jgi:hypothetical protein